NSSLVARPDANTCPAYGNGQDDVKIGTLRDCGGKKPLIGGTAVVFVRLPNGMEMLVPQQFGFGASWRGCPQAASPIAGSFWRVLPDTYAHVSDRELANPTQRVVSFTY